jgi:two-component sensor histidine kinase
MVCSVPATPVRPSARRGFGSRLIEIALVAAEFGSAVALDYPSSGVTCSIHVPLAAIQQETSRSA